MSLVKEMKDNLNKMENSVRAYFGKPAEGPSTLTVEQIDVAIKKLSEGCAQIDNFFDKELTVLEEEEEAVNTIYIQKFAKSAKMILEEIRKKANNEPELNAISEDLRTIYKLMLDLSAIADSYYDYKLNRGNANNPVKAINERLKVPFGELEVLGLKYPVTRTRSTRIGQYAGFIPSENRPKPKKVTPPVEEFATHLESETVPGFKAVAHRKSAALKKSPQKDGFLSLPDEPKVKVIDKMPPSQEEEYAHSLYAPATRPRAGNIKHYAGFIDEESRPVAPGVKTVEPKQKEVLAISINEPQAQGSHVEALKKSGTPDRQDPAAHFKKESSKRIIRPSEKPLKPAESHVEAEKNSSRQQNKERQ